MSRKNKHSKLEYFQRNAAGEYIYTGKHMAYVSKGKSRKRLLTELWGLGIGGGIFLLAGGFLPIESFRGCFYVLLPYIVALVAAFSCLWTISELTGGGEPMRQYVHDATVLKLPGRAMIAAVAAVLCILGQAIYCILHSGGTVGVLLAFFLLEGAGAAAMVLLFRCIRGANWQLEK